MNKEGRVYKVFVPRLIDADNYNAQNLNARSLLVRFNSLNIQWHTVYYNKPDPLVISKNNIKAHKLIRGRLWTWHLILLYLKKYDAIFYPGNEWYDAKALRIRKLFRLKSYIISTLEGLPWKSGRDEFLSSIIGHKVYTFHPRSGSSFSKFFDEVRNYSDLIIAISPFLQKAGKELYRKKVINLTLGIERTLFFPADKHNINSPVVIGSGTLYKAKRPDCFITLAKAIRHVDFIWYGDGPLREGLLKKIQKSNLNNISFPGAIPHEYLAKKLCESDVFVLPSKSEGVPKVTMEAASCGLPVIIFGNYESPSVINGVNGYVVWDDNELIEKLRELLTNREKAHLMGAEGANLAEQWNWDHVAREWEAEIAAYI